jgi:hypothetical protein
MKTGLLNLHIPIIDRPLTGFSSLRMGTSGGILCEHGNELWGSIKYEECIDYLRNSGFVKDCSMKLIIFLP